MNEFILTENRRIAGKTDVEFVHKCGLVSYRRSLVEMYFRPDQLSGRGPNAQG
jgi:hypothetical protein